MPRRTPTWRKQFARDEPVAYYRKRFKHYGGIESCEKINGAKVCVAGRRSMWPGGHEQMWRMLYCKGPHASDCMVEADMKPFAHRKQIYIHWYGAYPSGRGYGGEHFKTLKDWLEKKKCIKRITLHAVPEAEGFWERMGFEPLADVYQDSYGDTYDSRSSGSRYSRDYGHYQTNTKFRSEDRAWRHEYSSLRPYELVLHPPKTCR